MKKAYLIVITVAALIAAGQASQGAVLDSCAKWASYCSGGYCVYNNIWGWVSGSSQCIVAESCTNWTVTATHPANGIKSYPNSSLVGINGTTVGDLSSCISSVSASPPSGGTWNLSYDVWAPTEVMIWLKWQGPIGPWGSYVTSATIDGRGWYVYKNGYPGFLAQSQLSGGTFDIKAFMDYCVNQGWMSTSGNIKCVQCGYEIVAASDTTFVMNSYSVSYGTGEWLYGDFTYDNRVDMNDIPGFCEFWLNSDCEETAGLDLNGDCIINFHEFSTLAQNWLEEI